METCIKCDENKLDSKFHSGNEDGPICDECFCAAEEAAWLKAGRDEMIAAHEAAR